MYYISDFFFVCLFFHLSLFFLDVFFCVWLNSLWYEIKMADIKMNDMCSYNTWYVWRMQTRRIGSYECLPSNKCVLSPGREGGAGVFVMRGQDKDASVGWVVTQGLWYGALLARVLLFLNCTFFKFYFTGAASWWTFVKLLWIEDPQEPQNGRVISQEKSLYFITFGWVVFSIIFSFVSFRSLNAVVLYHNDSKRFSFASWANQFKDVCLYFVLFFYVLRLMWK